MSYEFSQGDIVWFNFPRDPRQPQYTINGSHPALILHDDAHPNQTIVLSPLSSLHNEQGIKKELKSYHLELLKKDYPKLKNDSYVKLDQLMTFSRHRVESASFICRLKEKDIAFSHLKIMESLQMQDTISELTQKQISRQVEKVVDEVLGEYIELLKKST